MPVAPNSTHLASRRHRWTARETILLHRWKGLEVFLAEAQDAIDREQKSGADPPEPHTIQGWLVSWLIEYAGSRQATLPATVMAGTLWFILASHLEASREPLCVYELDDDALVYARGIFAKADWSEEDRRLTAREAISLYLFGRGGCGPDWFRPMIEE